MFSGAVFFVVLWFADTAAASPTPFRPKPALLSAQPSRVMIRRDFGLWATTSFGSSVSAGSVALLVFAALAKRSVPVRSLVAALAVVATSVLLELLGSAGLGQQSLTGRSLSEAGQALAIAASGWAAFSAVWAAGYGSVLSPGGVPRLNLAGFAGALAAAILAASLRPASRAQTSAPFVSAVALMHLHLVVRPLPPTVDEPRLAPLALTTAALAMAVLCLDGAVGTVRGRAPRVAQTGGRGGRGGEGGARPAGASVQGLRRCSLAAPTSVREGRMPSWLRRVRGSAELVPASLALNLFWVSLTLTKWSAHECPGWGLAAMSGAISALQIGLHLYAARPGEPRLHPGWASTYELVARWLGLLAAWRALWPDEHLQARRLEAHFYSLVGCFGLWGATSALLERPVTAVLGALMVAVVVCRVMAGSLLESQSLVRAGVLGLGTGVAMLALLVKVGDDVVDGAGDGMGTKGV